MRDGPSVAHATNFPNNTFSVMSAEEKADIEANFRLNAESYRIHGDHLEDVRRLTGKVKNVPPPFRQIAENVLFNLRETNPGAVDFFTLSDDLGSVKELNLDVAPKSGAMRESEEEPWIEWDTGIYVVVSSDRFNIQLPNDQKLYPYDRAADIKLRAKTNLFQLTVVDRRGYETDIGPSPDRQELAREHGGLFFRGVPKMKLFGNPIRLGLQFGIDKHFNGLVSGVIDIEFTPPAN